MTNDKNSKERIEKRKSVQTRKLKRKEGELYWATSLPWHKYHIKKKNVQGPGILLFAQFQRGLSVSMAGYRKLSPVCASQTHKQKNYLLTKSIGPILPEFNWGSLVFTFLINTPGDDHILTSEAHLSETLQQKWKEGGYFDQCTLLIDFWTKLIKLYQINKHI